MGHGESEVTELDDRTCLETTTTDAINPSQNEMMVALNRVRSPKLGNGNRFFLSLGESVGRFFGFNNQIESDKLRADIAETCRAYLHVFWNALMEKTSRPGNALDAHIRDQMRNDMGDRNHEGEENWVHYWIKSIIEQDTVWADDDVAVGASAIHFNTHIVILYSDVFEKLQTEVINGVVRVTTWGGYLRGANPVLFTPDGKRRFMSFERLCVLFPPGQGRDDLKVLLYDGNSGDSCTLV